MPSFKQKNVIKSYKLRLQEKLRTVTEETENANSFLNNCLSEFQNRVQHILEIKDEKCLSLYRDLIRDLESYSEKLFILQASLEEASEEETDSENAEESESKSQKDPSNSEEASVSSLQNEDLLSGSNCKAAPVKPKLVNYYEGGGSITEDDFHSLPSDSASQITNAVLWLNSLTEKEPSESIHDKFQSSQSFTQSSCYRSLSSTISEPLVLGNDYRVTDASEPQSSELKKQISLECDKLELVISPLDVKIPSSICATLSHIINPGDFWIQIENTLGSNITFPKADYSHLKYPSSIQEGNYCLAPFKSSPYYCRAQSLSSANFGKDIVAVHFLDHGSTQDILLSDLRTLPSSAYSIPAQALHCYLYGIASLDGTWSKECIEKFKDFQNFCIDTVVKSKESLYAVQLTAKLSEDLDEDFSVDIAVALCLEGLAISENEPLLTNIAPNQTSEIQYGQLSSKTADLSLEVSESYDITAISNDSGVSVTSAYKSCENSVKKEHEFGEISNDPFPVPIINSSNDSCNRFDFNYDTKRHQSFTSFESCDTLCQQNSSEVLKTNNTVFKSICHICKRNNFCLHLKLPPPSLVFVEKDMMVVMLSYIVNPQEFYVNMAMENIVNLDELRELMTNTYESQRDNFPQVMMEDLSENMYCAGYYDTDGYWYRVKIIRINTQDKKNNLVFVQYVDYGNTATIKCSDLQPLTPQFSQHPVFAIKCFLAGIMPVKGGAWCEDAISSFKHLTSFDRCLTAQICSELSHGNNDSYPVLLWDTEESNDLLINVALADLGAAKFDNSFLHTIPSKSEIPNPSNVVDNDVLSTWDPMAEEYNDIENSYGVDDDIQVATTGYKARDEEYTCKYFSLRGYCPRGSSCPYEHLSLLESGVTRDQEEVFCLDSLLIIPETIQNTLIQVSAIVNPGHFYVVFPFECRTVNEIDSLVNRGSSYEEITNNEAKSLFFAIDKHYSNTPFEENTTIALACGTIVAARRKWDKHWHRGRVIDVSDISGPSQIFFVDSGDSEWVPRKLIRTILPQFLYTPFQAVQCSLHGVKPIGSKDNKWSSEALLYFKDIVEEKMLLAEIIHRFGSILHITLRKTSKNHHQDIGQLLISKGFAEFCAVGSSNKRECRYMPG